MSTHKTRIDQELVETFLKKRFENVSNLKSIESGESSQAFSFGTNADSFVIRVNGRKKSFEKDHYAYEHFSSTEVPIPEILEIGSIGVNLFFAISRKAVGKIIDELSEKEFNATLPNLLEVLDAIHKIDVRKQRKYGGLDTNGRARFNSWKEFLLSIKDGGKGKWPDLFMDTFMEKSIFEKLYAKLTQLVDYCFEDIYLVHGDYGFNNLLADNGKITGVLDWNASKYGDFLYDAAWLAFWSENFDFESLLEKHYTDKNTAIRHFKERVLCYKVHLALGSLNFYAYSGQEQKYIWARDRIMGMISN